jgi:sRNA-binding protein
MSLLSSPAAWVKRKLMRDLARALEELRDDLAGIQHEISILEQIARELVDLDGAGAGPLIQRHIDEIAKRMTVAQARQMSIARMMEECGSERRAAQRAAKP